ncbi:MAG: hypothetical protein RL223_4806 [Pseudomonadota bacterium]
MHAASPFALTLAVQIHLTCAVLALLLGPAQGQPRPSRLGPDLGGGDGGGFPVRAGHP